jgi:hypothetical protein
VRNVRNNAVRRRTPRLPVIAPADKNTIDEATPGTENTINATKRKYEAANKDCAIVPTDDCSPDRCSGITETSKAGLHTLLETKGTGDTVICQQQLKKARIQQPKEEGQTSKVENETVMASDEGNKLVDSLKPHELSNIISEGIF